jgi:DNA-binding winged helix-turn-helix (wHTH) protein
MSQQTKQIYKFGPFHLDSTERLLLRDGEVIPLQPKVFDLLLALVAHHGHLLEKDELLSLVWPDTIVEESNLTYNISHIRKALGDGENGHRYIETAPKRGYRFVARVRKAEAESAELNVAKSPDSPDLAEVEEGTADQSAQPLTFALEAVRATSPSVSAQALAPLRSRRRLWFLAGIGLLAVVALAAFLIGRRLGSAPGGRAAQTPPSFQRLTFRLGSVWSARFAPDGLTIIYGATWKGDKHQLYQTRIDSSESRPLGHSDADILAISSTGEMALALQPAHLGRQIRGTLASMPLAGSAPRHILRDVWEADYAPDGKQLAVVRIAGDRRRLEFPLGSLLYESSQFITSLRISPKGDLLAFIEARTLVVMDLAGKKKVLSGGWRTLDGLAWSPTGDEVWFTASEVGHRADLYAVTLAGEQRVVLRSPDQLRLADISRDGVVLLRRISFRKGIMALPLCELVSRRETHSHRGDRAGPRRAQLHSRPRRWKVAPDHARRDHREMGLTRRPMDYRRPDFT